MSWIILPENKEGKAKMIRLSDIKRIEFSTYEWSDHEVFIEGKEEPIKVPNKDFDLLATFSGLSASVAMRPPKEEKDA